MHCTAAIGLLLFGLAAAQAQQQDATFLNGNLYEGAIEAGQADAPYWWMNKGSPFKRSYEAAQPATNYNSNPFLQGNQNYVAAASAPAPYAAPGYLPPTQNVPTISCTARGQVCVAKYLCRNGFVDRDVTDGSKQTCNAENEVCCTIREAPVPTPAPRPQGIPCQDKNYGCVSPDQCYNGVVSSLNGFSSKPAGQNCFAPEVCCRFSDLSPSPNHISEQHITQRPAPATPAEVLTSEGYVITVPEQKLPPQQPATQRPYQPTVPVTQRPYVGQEYVPPQVGDYSNDRPTYVQQPQQPQTPAPQPTYTYKQPPTPPQQRPTPNYNYKPTVAPVPVHRGEDEKSQPIGTSPSNNRPSIIRPQQDAPPQLPPTQCPAATNCTEIQFCSANGIISKTPVVLTQEQEVYRVPLSDCRSAEFGFVGKCCRDPDYTDPWPVGILGQYNASILGFDDGSYKPSAGRNANNGNPQGPRGVPQQQPQQQRPAFGQPQQQQFGGETVPSASNTVAVRGQGQLSQPIAVGSPSNNQYSRQPFPAQQHPNQIPQQRERDQPNHVRPIAHTPSSQCATRDSNAFPKGQGPYDAAFGEFPWQAMILKESTKSLLCGGAIIQADTVLTAANCVQGQKPYDILIKGGEWKLGSDEEPKPFQTVRVKSISFHPEYQSFGRDVALLHLEIDLKFDAHIAPICIDEQDAEPQAGGQDQCVCTGWGKDALKYHAPQALMHQIPIAPLAQNECAAALPGFNQQTATCGRPQVDACQIDVGSALACTRGNGQYVLKGLYSAENQCNSPAQVVTFAKMDVAWIKDTMGAPSQQVLRQAPQQQQPQYPQQGQQQLAQPLQPQPQQSQQQQQIYNPAIPSTQAPSYLPPRN